MYSGFKRAQPYIRAAGRHTTKRYKKPIRRAANKAVDWFEKVTGFGDYSVKGNTLMTDNAPPMFQSSGQGLRVAHREFLGDITGSSEFVLRNYSINPGRKQTFPWLAQIAKHFEQYQMNGLIFEFRSTSGDAIASTNNALGAVIMATEYDVYDENYSSKQQMQQSMFCCSGPTSQNLMHPIECDPSSLPTQNLFVRAEDDSGDRDLRFQDMGRFQLATQGQQAAVTIGELWVTYDVTLLKAQPPSDDVFSDVVSYNCIVGAGTASPFGSVGSQVLANGSLPGFIISPTSISFPPGYESTSWILSYSITGVAAAFTGMNVVLTNCAGKNIFPSGAINQTAAGNTTTILYQLGFTTDSSGQALIDLTAGSNLPSVPSLCVLTLTRVTKEFSY